ncbi:laminin G domain-containing protein [Nocardioides sp. MAHUQ-72]|uniref:laminin G domain-containing protein n=1 Tax=unclassified Nocardioides TaxID=2615069 RepID=UPI003618AE9F
MRARPPGVLLAVLLLLAGGTATASSLGSAPTAAQPRARAVLKLTFNHDTLRPGSRVHNAAGRYDGVVRTADGGRLTRVRGVKKAAAQYPGSCAGCGAAIIEVADRRRLDPRQRNIRFGADIRMSASQEAHHSNLIQKGYYRTAGGQIKLQVDLGRPSCVVSGFDGRAIALWDHRITDRQWHRVVCKRKATGVVLRVDGKVRARTQGATGRVSNDLPVRIGGKKLGPGRVDQYHGRMDNVFIRYARRPA